MVLENSKKENFCIERDYDKNPIIIEDYNYIFNILYVLWGGVLITYFYIFNPFHNSNEISKNYWYLHFILMSLLPTITFYIQNKKSKRKILLQEKDILFIENEVIIEKLLLNEIKSVKKTFNDYYKKNQEIEDWSIVFAFLFLPFNLPIQLINKFLFHTFKNGISSYKFFDSIILFDINDKFINILPTTLGEYELINDYFRKKIGLDTKTLNVYFKINYGNETMKPSLNK